jgi:hypothetical protein
LTKANRGNNKKKAINGKEGDLIHIGIFFDDRRQQYHQNIQF